MLPWTRDPFTARINPLLAASLFCLNQNYRDFSLLNMGTVKIIRASLCMQLAHKISR